MPYTFSQVPTADIPRSSFNRSHGHKTTFDSGYLIPFYVDEALPGDTFAVNASVFARLATPKVPIMDNLHMDVFFFFVPNRLVWDNWQRFMGEQVNPGESTDYRVPQVASGVGGFGFQSIYDYMGIPPDITGVSVNALPFRAYNLIWNEWFRDENLQTSLTVNKTDGPDDASVYAIRKRGKRHDYFTSCLPWPQKGPGVELPIGLTAPVIPNTIGAVPQFVISTGGASPLFTESITANEPVKINAGGAGQLGWYDSGLYADLQSATVVTINQMREAFQVQRLLERDARGGTRYTEILRSHFGVVSPDARLQRPEYLGGGTIPVIVNPVVQTSGTAVDPATGYTPTPQGNLAAYGVVGNSRVGFTKSFVEHGYVIGLVMVRADLSYQQGTNRMWSRKTRYDFYWPVLSHLGEQAVLNKEIYTTGVTAEDEGVFGYQERWAEYRYFPAMITGKFRSRDPQSLDYWHLAKEFVGLPALNAAFIADSTDEVVDRMVAVTDEPQWLFDSHIRINAVRPMPMYSVPGLIDHF